MKEKIDWRDIVLCVGSTVVGLGAAEYVILLTTAICPPAGIMAKIGQFGVAILVGDKVETSTVREIIKVDRRIKRMKQDVKEIIEKSKEPNLTIVEDENADG